MVSVTFNFTFVIGSKGNAKEIFSTLSWWSSYGFCYQVCHDNHKIQHSESLREEHKVHHF